MTDTGNAAGWRPAAKSGQQLAANVHEAILAQEIAFSQVRLQMQTVVELLLVATSLQLMDEAERMWQLCLEAGHHREAVQWRRHMLKCQLAYRQITHTGSPAGELNG